MTAGRLPAVGTADGGKVKAIPPDDAVSGMVRPMRGADNKTDDER